MNPKLRRFIAAMVRAAQPAPWWRLEVGPDDPWWRRKLAAFVRAAQGPKEQR